MLDAVTGRGIPGVRATVGESRTVTDFIGDFEFAGSFSWQKCERYGYRQLSTDEIAGPDGSRTIWTDGTVRHGHRLSQKVYRHVTLIHP